MNILKHETDENKNKNFDRTSTLTLKNTKPIKKTLTGEVITIQTNTHRHSAVGSIHN